MPQLLFSCLASLSATNVHSLVFLSASVVHSLACLSASTVVQSLAVVHSLALIAHQPSVNSFACLLASAVVHSLFCDLLLTANILKILRAGVMLTSYRLILKNHVSVFLLLLLLCSYSVPTCKIETSSNNCE